MALKPIDPLAVPVAEPGVEVALCRRTRGHCAPSRQAHEPTNRRRDPPLHPAAEPHQAERPICRALAPSCRRSMPWQQSPSARHEPDVAGDSLTSDRQGGAAGHRGWFRGFSQAVPVADPDQSLKAPKATNPQTRIFPLGVRAVLGRAAGGGKRRLWQGRAASCAEQASVKEEHPATHHRPYHSPLRACRNPAPLVGICAAGLVKPHPRGRDAGTGFANLSGN